MHTTHHKENRPRTESGAASFFVRGRISTLARTSHIGLIAYLVKLTKGCACDTGAVLETEAPAPSQMRVASSGQA